jgi:hypothetical protein
MAELSGFTEREIPTLPPDPYPVTIVTSNGSDYEYAQRQTTLEDPVDVSSLATGRLAIVGIHSSPSFYKSIDITVGIASAITQHASVHSEPYLFTGTTTLNNTRLDNAWHFRADPFTGTQGIGVIWGVVDEFGFAFSSPILADNSYGFYYGPPGSPVTTGDWGVFIDANISNYFKDLVLIGNYTSIGAGGATEPEPILQVFDNNSKQGEYVESIVGVGVRPDTRYQLNVKKSISATLAGRFEGNVKVQGDAEVTGKVSVGGNELSISVVGSNLTITVTGIGSTTLKLA